MVLTSIVAELVLATVAAVAAGATFRRRPGSAWLPAALGLALLSCAAVLGAVRYGGIDAIVPAHTVASRLAAAGLAVVGIAWCGVAFRRGPWRWLAWAVLAAAVLLTAVWVDGPWRLPLGVIGVGFGLFGAAASLRRRTGSAIAGLVGAAGVVVAGLAFDTSASLWGIPQVDLFHLSLATAVALYVGGLVGRR